MWSEYVWADQRAVDMRRQGDEARRVRAARGDVRARRWAGRGRPAQPAEVVCLRAAATGRAG